MNGDTVWSAFDQEDADLGAAMQVAGSVSVPGAPNPGAVIGDWATALGNVGKGVAGIATAIGNFQLQRDQFAASQQDRSFNQALRSSELDLARANLASKTDLGKLQLATTTDLAKLNLATQLANAKAAMTPGSISSFLYPFTSGTASAGSYVSVALLGIGAWFLFKTLQKK